MNFSCAARSEPFLHTPRPTLWLGRRGKLSHIVPGRRGRGGAPARSAEAGRSVRASIVHASNPIAGARRLAAIPGSGEPATREPRVPNPRVPRRDDRMAIAAAIPDRLLSGARASAARKVDRMVSRLHTLRRRLVARGPGRQASPGTVRRYFATWVRHAAVSSACLRDACVQVGGIGGSPAFIRSEARRLARPAPHPLALGPLQQAVHAAGIPAGRLTPHGPRALCRASSMHKGRFGPAVPASLALLDLLEAAD